MILLSKVSSGMLYPLDFVIELHQQIILEMAKPIYRPRQGVVWGWEQECEGVVWYQEQE